VPYVGIKAYTELSKATQAAQELDHALSKLLYAPNDETLATARNAWRAAYDRYLATLIYARLPLQDPEEWLQKGIGYQQTLVQLGAWPVEPGYIDYVPDYPFSGIVNDLALPLSRESLLGEHLLSAQSAASIGFHPLEFMLWSMDGLRPWQDFVAQENTAPSPQNNSEGADAIDLDATTHSINVQNHQRRRQYLRLLGEGIHRNLNRLQRRFEPSTGHYASELEHADPQQVLRASLRSTQKLVAEDLIKRLNEPSSDFSHSTEADMLALIAGIEQLFLPSTEPSYGLAQLLANSDPTLVEAWPKQLAELKASIHRFAQSSDKEQKQAQQEVTQRCNEFLALVQQSALKLGITLPVVTVN
jgi:putative iron-regulated protein